MNYLIDIYQDEYITVSAIRDHLRVGLGYISRIMTQESKLYIYVPRDALETHREAP